MTDSMPNRSRSSLRTRASLVARLKNPDDAASWQEFHDLYRRLILAVARQSGLTSEESEDAAQETLAAMAKHIGEFEYDPQRCSFKNWLLMIARQRIIWQLRRRRPGAGSESDGDSSGDTTRTAIIERIPDPQSADIDALWDQEWKQTLYKAALDRVRQLVSERQFQIFDLVVSQQWTTAQVMNTLQVSRTQVYLARHRVGAALKRELRKLNAEL